MEITITKELSETIDLNKEQVKNIIRRYVSDELGGKHHNVEMVSGKLCVTYWEDTHGSGITTVIRDATELDIALELVRDSTWIG